MSRAVVLLASLAIACGPGAPPSPAPEPTAGDEHLAPAAPPETAETPPEPPRPPCAASPPTRESLARMGQPGVLRVDAAAPQHTGECVSPAVLAAEHETIACDEHGLRCALGARAVLLSREQSGACVPLAIVTYGGEPPASEVDAVIASLVQRDEACALHDVVARGEASFYQVDRARRVAPGRRGVLTSECVREVEATARAEGARAHWQTVPLACHGLRCRDASAAPIRAGEDAPADAERVRSAAGPAPRWLFANRVSGPLRFDAVAVGELSLVLRALRDRCR